MRKIESAQDRARRLRMRQKGMPSGKSVESARLFVAMGEEDYDEAERFILEVYAVEELTLEEWENA